MLTYQVRPRQFRLRGGSEPAFPADVVIKFHFLPKQPFGVVNDGGRTLTKGSPGGILFNLNTGQHSARSERALGDLLYRKDLVDGFVELCGNVLTRKVACPDLCSLSETIQRVYFILPSLLSLRYADPPYVERVSAEVDGVEFTWELEEFFGPSQVTTKELQECRFAKAWDELERLEATDRRLVAALTYFRTGCRLLREAKTPGEFLSEALLNFAKVLETLFPGAPDKTRESVRVGLRSFGLADDTIDRDLIPLLLLRSQFDVAHVSLSLLTVAQATTLQRYAERMERVLASFLEELVERVSAGSFVIVPYEDTKLDPSAAKTIERLKQNLDALGDKW